MRRSKIAVAISVWVAAALMGRTVEAEGEAAELPAPKIEMSVEHGVTIVNMALALPHPASEVWDVLKNFGDNEVGSDVASEVRYVGNKSGGVRTIVLKPELGGGTVSERISDVDQLSRSFRYTLIDFGNAPFADYEGYLKISAAGDKASVIYYRARMFPTSITSEAAAEFAANNMVALQRRLHLMLSD